MLIALNDFCGVNHYLTKYSGSGGSANNISEALYIKWTFYFSPHKKIDSLSKINSPDSVG